MLNPLENYFLKQPGSHQACMLYLRTWLIEQGFEEKQTYGIPMYYYKSKHFCYMSVSSKEKKLYIGFGKAIK